MFVISRSTYCQRTKLASLPPPPLVGPDGLEPSTPRLSSVCSNQLSYEPFLSGGAERVRTDDLLNANQPLFQLSYGPFSSARQRILLSNANFFQSLSKELSSSLKLTKYDCTTSSPFSNNHLWLSELLLRKEVIQPQVPLRLPCYDLVPITSLAIGRCLSCELTHRLRAKPAFMT